MPQENIPLKDLIDLTGKGAIVTGGARGIGLAIAHRLAEAGAAVLIADTDTREAEKAREELKGRGYTVHFARCDVSREDEVQKMVNVAAARMGGIDILVNNAGIYPRKPLLEMTAADFERVIAVNLTGTFLCSRYASQDMVERKRAGCIINIASIEAVHPSSTGMSAYDASKGGVLMLTRSLARELGPHGIRVNAIAPGGIMTRGMLSHMGTPTREEEKTQLKELKEFMARMALGRMGEADDIARVVIFLASEMAGYITGEMVVVDGGYLVS
jgi:NAD(P)-dependent dehydrogenase (short-subunit alcohol dehydrogenase family)